MKPALLFSILTMLPLFLFAQADKSLDSIKRNLIPFKELKLSNVETSHFLENSVSTTPKVIDECHELGDFYVSSSDKNAILVSNINNPSIVDSILPAPYPYGGSIGIITHEGTLINSRFDSVSYYSDNGWAYYGHYSTTNDLIHCAGGNKTVFYMGGHLWHLNGNNQPQKIYENIKYACADLVVDSLERAWVLTGKNWPIADTLRIIDSTGYQTCKFPLKVPFNTVHAYGMLMYQGKIWLGIGPANPLYPNKLLPLEIIDNKIVAGTPVDFPSMNYLDLESCEVGLPEFNCPTTHTTAFNEDASIIDVFPNPSSDWIYITSKVMMDKIEIFNTSGITLMKITPIDKQTKINLEKLPSGVYFIRLQSEDKSKIIKQIKN